MNNNLSSWLDHLRILCPPTGVVLVGAGAGTGDWVQRLMQWGTHNVTLVEADETQFEHLQRSLALRDGWHLRQQVIARSTETVTYHLASNMLESGLLAPESLRSLWPHLKTRQKQTRQAIALADLQQNAETPANWLLVDCLPALPIIQGASNQLAAFDVIALRVLLDGQALRSSEATLDELQPALQILGFRCLAIEAGRHPALGHALFVRDTPAQARQLQQQLALQAQTHQAETQTLAQGKLEADKLANERQQQIDQLQAQVKQTAGQAQAAAQEAQKAQATAAAATASTAAATKQAEERTVQVQQLTQAKAAADKQAAERQQQIDQLQAQVKQTAGQAQAAAQEAQKAQATAAAATASTAAATKQAEERTVQVQQLTQAKAAADKQAAERQQQIDQLMEEAAQAKAAADKLATEKQHQVEKLTDQIKLAMGAGEHTTQQIAALKHQQEQLAPALSATNQLPNQWKAFADAITSRMAGTESALAQLSQQLSPAHLPELLLPKLSERFLEQSKAQKNQLNEAETRLRSDFGKGLGNAVKQLEAFFSIQNYLNTGESISDFHGWPISPDIGLFLIEKIRERQYDLIIEFGSGTSTLMFAKALSVNEKIVNQKANEKNNTSFKKILSIEHDTVYLEKTRIKLESENLDNKVNLYHAPLANCIDGEDEYLYYSCEKILKQTAEEFQPGIKKILVLVDGPPSATCANARYLAAPYIFNVFGNHQIDIVLDDANRPEEKSVIEMWRTLWKKRSIHINEKNIASEKGIFLASNYS